MSRAQMFPDPVEHAKHYGWLKAKSQAAYRKEPFEITLEQWFELWSDDLWARRGRKSQDLSLSRIDWDKPWSILNVEITTRRKQVKKSIGIHYERRHGKPLH